MSHSAVGCCRRRRRRRRLTALRSDGVDRRRAGGRGNTAQVPVGPSESASEGHDGRRHQSEHAPRACARPARARRALFAGIPAFRRTLLRIRSTPPLRAAPESYNTPVPAPHLRRQHPRPVRYACEYADLQNLCPSALQLACILYIGTFIQHMGTTRTPLLCVE